MEMSEPARELFHEETVEINAEIPMRWHDFLVKIMLWLAAAGHALQAVWIFTGMVYFSFAARDEIYAGLPLLRLADYALGLALLCAAALFVMARKLLREQKSKGIARLATAYIILAAAQPVHALARYAISGLSPLSVSAIAQTAAYLLLLLVNASYYRKRRTLFS